MEPRFSVWLTESQYRRKHDDLEHEYVAYRPPVEPVWPHLARPARRRLAAFFLALGTRLSDEPLAAMPVPEIDPTTQAP